MAAPEKCFVCGGPNIRYAGQTEELKGEGKYDLYECDDCEQLSGVPVGESGGGEPPIDLNPERIN